MMAVFYVDIREQPADILQGKKIVIFVIFF